MKYKLQRRRLTIVDRVINKLRSFKTPEAYPDEVVSNQKAFLKLINLLHPGDQITATVRMYVEQPGFYFLSFYWKKEPISDQIAAILTLLYDVTYPGIVLLKSNGNPYAFARACTRNLSLKLFGVDNLIELHTDEDSPISLRVKVNLD